MTILSVRLNKEIESKLDFLIEKLHISDKSSYVRQLLEGSLKERVIDYYSQQVDKREMSAWKAAEMCGLSLREMLKILKEKKISGYNEEMLAQDLTYALSKDLSKDEDE